MLLDKDLEGSLFGWDGPKDAVGHAKEDRQAQAPRPITQQQCVAVCVDDPPRESQVVPPCAALLFAKENLVRRVVDAGQAGEEDPTALRRRPSCGGGHC